MAIVSRDLATYHVGALMLVFITICLSLCPTVCHAGYLAVNFLFISSNLFFFSISLLQNDCAARLSSLCLFDP